MTDSYPQDATPRTLPAANEIEPHQARDQRDGASQFR